MNQKKNNKLSKIIQAVKHMFIEYKSTKVNCLIQYF